MVGTSVVDNLKAVQNRIAAACARCDRDPASVRLIAVSKGQSLEKLRLAFAAGQRRFGENYVQEADLKRAVLADAEWHFIGRVQSNKVKSLVGSFHLIHSIDRETIVQSISVKAHKRGIVQRVLIEINVGGEGSKGGVAPEEAREFIRRARQLPGVQLGGLMCMPPPGPAESVRLYFRRLRQILEENRDDGFLELSMGTSQDFETAIEEGATLVRIGTDIFGPRSKSKEAE